MCFVYDDDRPTDAKRVRQRVLNRTVLSLLETAPLTILELCEVLHQRSGGFVHFSSFRILNAECLHRRYNDCGRGIKCGAFDVQRFSDIENRHSTHSGFQSLTVRVRPVSERLQRLLADGIGWHNPENNAAVALEQLFRGNADRMAGDKRLTTSRWDAKTHVTHSGEL